MGIHEIKANLSSVKEKISNAVEGGTAPVADSPRQTATAVSAVQTGSSVAAEESTEDNADTDADADSSASDESSQSYGIGQVSSPNNDGTQISEANARAWSQRRMEATPSKQTDQEASEDRLSKFVKLLGPSAQ